MKKLLMIGMMTTSLLAMANNVSERRTCATVAQGAALDVDWIKYEDDSAQVNFLETARKSNKLIYKLRVGYQVEKDNNKLNSNYTVEISYKNNGKYGVGAHVSCLVRSIKETRRRSSSTR